MGIFDLFSKKPAVEAPRVEPGVPDLPVLEDRVENPEVKEIKGWAKFVGAVRQTASNAKLKLLGVDQKAIKAKEQRVERDKVFTASKYAPEVPLEKIYTADFNVKTPVVKPVETFVAKSADEIEAEKLLQVKKGLIKNFAEGRSDEELKEAVEIQKDKELADMYPSVKSYNVSGDKDETGGTRSEREKERTDRSLTISELQKIKDERTVAPEIKVVNTDAISVSQKPVSTNESFVNDAFNLEMKRREQEKNNPAAVPVAKVEAKKESPANALIARFKARSAQNIEKLKVIGNKSMDWHRDLSRTDKIKFGAAMAGMGILSGGITTVASKSFAVSRAIRSAYDREVVKITNGVKRELDTAEKRKAVLKACALGALIGGVGFGLSEVFETLNDIAPEIASTVTQSVAEVVPEKDLIYEVKSVMDGADNPIQTDPGVVMDIPTSYEFVKGDNLGQVLLDKVFGDSDLSAKDRLTEIYNMFASPEGKALLAQSGITDVDDIKAGSKINLQKFADLIKTLNK